MSAHARTFRRPMNRVLVALASLRADPVIE
jgi:hypothetical protein